jgi:hypothetical protein
VGVERARPLDPKHIHGVVNNRTKVLITAAIVDFGVFRLSGLTKKSVYADKVLATILGVREGDHVSYAQLSKGIHQYIREKNLKNPPPLKLNATPMTFVPPAEVTNTVVTAIVTKRCRDCGVEIPAGAVFCDLCGVQQ